MIPLMCGDVEASPVWFQVPFDEQPLRKIVSILSSEDCLQLAAHWATSAVIGPFYRIETLGVPSLFGCKQQDDLESTSPEELLSRLMDHSCAVFKVIEGEVGLRCKHARLAIERLQASHGFGSILNDVFLTSFILV
jgi:hypothetical protein